MKSALKTYETYIFDMDGTFYSQKKMRLKMLFRLLKYFSVHIEKWRELKSIYVFRKLREMEDYKSYSMDELYAVVAEKASITKDIVEGSIQRWMFEVPLEIICECSYRDVIQFLNERSKEGARIFIYSDYPAEEKAKSIGIHYDGIFVSEEIGRGELKPSKSAMEYILQEIGANREDILYVGDRKEKDGKSAEYANVEYMDIKLFKREIGREECNVI